MKFIYLYIYTIISHIPWKKEGCTKKNYMSFVWNLKQKAVRDKNVSPCVIFQNDMMATRPISCISLWGPWRKMQLKSTLQFWEPVTKKNKTYLASQTILLISLWAETVESASCYLAGLLESVVRFCRRFKPLTLCFAVQDRLMRNG